MTTDWVRTVCLKLPHTTEEVLWGGDLVFKIGGKMYAVAALEPGAVWLSFKCTPEKFSELTEREGIVPAPYLARHHWVALESGDALPAAELKRLIGESYELVLGKLAKKAQVLLRGGFHRGGAETQRKRTKKNMGRTQRAEVTSVASGWQGVPGLCFWCLLKVSRVRCGRSYFFTDPTSVPRPAKSSFTLTTFSPSNVTKTIFPGGVP